MIRGERRLKKVDQKKCLSLKRNPKDVAVSSFHHFNAMSRIVGKKYDWNAYIEEMMDVIEGIKRESDAVFLLPGLDWFTYELDAESKMNRLDHAIVLYYEDLKEDMLPQLKRLSTFLGREYDDGFLEKIAERTNLDFVKKNKDVSMCDGMLSEGSLYRKGIIGDWKNYFSADQSRRFDAIIDVKMKNCPIMDNVRFEASK